MGTLDPPTLRRKTNRDKVPQRLRKPSVDSQTGRAKAELPKLDVEHHQKGMARGDPEQQKRDLSKVVHKVLADGTRVMKNGDVLSPERNSKSVSFGKVDASQVHSEDEDTVQTE